MINLLLAEPALDKYDVSSVRAIWTGGAPIRPATLESLGAMFGDLLGSTYGMTEATGIAGMRHRLSDDPLDRQRLASVGRPLPLLDVEVRRPDGAVAADGEPGEIVVRGDTVMVGYWATRPAPPPCCATVGSTPATSPAATPTAISTSSTAG